MEKFLDPNVLKSILRRRWIFMIAPVLLLMPIVVSVAYILPAVYSATARILVESQQIPSDLARSTVNVGVAERIALIEQRLMTRSNLLDMAQRLGVAAERRDLSPTDLVDLMRSSTDIRGVRFGGGATGVNITFTSSSAQLSATAANQFLSLLLERNIQQRTSRAEETSDYFRAERERLSRELSAVEAEIAAFKIDNEAASPESLNFRREERSRLQQQVFGRELEILRLQEQKQQILEAVRRGEYTALGRPLSPEEEELQRLRQSLVQRRSTYADNHPIVRSLEARIDVLQARVDVQIAEIDPEALLDPDNEGTGLSRQVSRLIKAIDTQITRLEERRVSEEARIKSLSESIDRTPSVALALSRLERQMETLQVQYRETTLKLAQAETGERLEVNQQAERFEVIERAEAPPRPTSPNRQLIVAAGFVGTAGFGVAIALLLELLNRSIRTPADLQRELDIRPIVAVPYIPTAYEAWRRRWTPRVVLVALLVATPSAMLLVDRYYLPLPVLIERGMDAAGADRIIALIRDRLN